MRNKLNAAISRLRSDFSLLIFFWLAGLLLGTCAVMLDPSYFSWMRPSLSQRVSIVTSVIAALFPFLLAALAVHINITKLLYILSFAKAFSFAFCGFLIWNAFGTAGWLYRFLLMFSDIILVPVFCWYCIRSIADSRQKGRDIAVCSVIAIAAASMDYFVISPFLAGLISI